MKPEQHHQSLQQSQHEQSLEGEASVAEDKNVMPSMVVRQQRIQMGISANQRGASGFSAGQRKMTTCDVESITSSSSLLAANQELSGVSEQHQVFDQNGLIVPKRLLHHPVSLAQPIMRDLNRELKFNQIRGKNVLDTKSELKKALEKHEETKRKKEAELERLSRRTSLELRLEQRAEQIAKGASDQSSKGQQGANSEQTQAAATCNHLSNFSIKSITR